MKLKIRIDYKVVIEKDLGANDDFAVKIRQHGDCRSYVLQKGENDQSPVCAKEFFEYLEERKKDQKDFGIVLEENVSGNKAWISESDEDCDCVINMECSTDVSSGGAVLVSFT